MRKRPGEVRDAIVEALSGMIGSSASVTEITDAVSRKVGTVAPSSVRSYLRPNTPTLFSKMDRAQYALKGFEVEPAASRSDRSQDQFTFGKATLVHADCMEWLREITQLDTCSG